MIDSIDQFVLGVVFVVLAMLVVWSFLTDRIQLRFVNGIQQGWNRLNTIGEESTPLPRVSAIPFCLRRPFLFVAVVMLGLLCGLVGGWFATDEPASGFVDHLSDTLYVSVQHLLQNGSPDESNFFLRVAQLCGVSIIAIVGFEVISRLFADSFQLWRLRACRGHTIVCGLGEIGSQLVRELAPIRNVVAVDIAPDGQAIVEARDCGAIAFEGDALRDGVMHWLRPADADEIFVVTGSDERNLEYLSRIVPMLGTDGPTVHLHLDHIDLRHLLPRFAGESGGADAAKLHAFNMTDRVVQELLDTHLLDNRPTGDEVAHFVVVGFGDLGRRLLLALANFAHYENCRRSRITVVYTADEQSAVDAFREDYPNLFPSIDCRIDPWCPPAEFDDWNNGVEVCTPGRFTKGDCGIAFVANGGFVQHTETVNSDRLVSRIVQAANRGDVRLSVILARGTEQHNCTDAVELRNDLVARLHELQRSEQLQKPKHPVTIYPFVPARANLAGAIRRTDGDVRLVPFGSCRDVCRHADITEDLPHALARLIDATYQRQLAGGSSPGFEPEPFEQRVAWIRHSSLCAALHVRAKFRAVGLAIVRAADDQSATGADIDVQQIADRPIAEMEHNRYVAERLLNGWVFGDPEQPCETGRGVRFQLVPFDNMPPEEQKKDIAQLRAMIDFIHNSPIHRFEQAT